MITLSLLKFLEENGFGTIDTDLFFQKLTLDKVGIYISDIGNTTARGSMKVQGYELYSRGKSDTDGYKRLSDVVEFLSGSFNNCVLPSVPPITNEPIKNVTIMPVSTITNVGLDDNNRVIYSATGTLIF